jgi:3-methyladenine DNA glycosylase/8-oxoguanine DNA glycosylase
MDGMRREWRPDWPCPVGQVWAHWRRGAGDPTYHVDEAGRHWRALATPVGAATLRVLARPGLGAIEADTWGPGASWVLEHLPTMLGADDDPSGMPLEHEAVRRAAREHPHWRVGRGGLVWDVLAPAIIEQKVTGQEASAGLFRLVRRYGTPAPGPGGALGLWVLPGASAVRTVPSWEWLTMGIDGARSSTLVRAARVADSLQRVVGLPGPDAERRLRSVPGIGVWTAALVRSRALGDPDAVSFADYHVARNISWALIGEELDDAGVAELLVPYAGHRYRVQRLLELAGVGHPRHGPRMAPRTHLPAR